MNRKTPLPDPTTAETFGELNALATDFVQKLGGSYFSYLLTREPAHAVKNGDRLISNYPKEWLDRYSSKKYRLYDPVVRISSNVRLPYLWGQRGFLRHFDKKARHIFHEAGEFQILEGYSVPTLGPDQDAGVFSVVTKNRNMIRHLIEEDEAGAIQLFAVKFHDSVVRLSRQDTADTQIKLTAREAEVLLRTADGYSSEAVAARLGLSASAVNYHITNACRKLGASNKVQAVAIAIRSNLI
nr:LuxR family transcriptional regulator [uncultured Cohaesibacter sp.]